MSRRQLYVDSIGADHIAFVVPYWDGEPRDYVVSLLQLEVTTG